MYTKDDRMLSVAGEDDSDAYNASDIVLDQQDFDPRHYALVGIAFCCI